MSIFPLSQKKLRKAERQRGHEFFTPHVTFTSRPWFKESNAKELIDELRAQVHTARAAVPPQAPLDPAPPDPALPVYNPSPPIKVEWGKTFLTPSALTRSLRSPGTPWRSRQEDQRVRALDAYFDDLGTGQRYLTPLRHPENVRYCSEDEVFDTLTKITLKVNPNTVPEMEREERAAQEQDAATRLGSIYLQIADEEKERNAVLPRVRRFDAEFLREKHGLIICDKAPFVRPGDLPAAYIPQGFGMVVTSVADVGSVILSPYLHIMNSFFTKGSGVNMGFVFVERARKTAMRGFSATAMEPRFVSFIWRKVSLFIGFVVCVLRLRVESLEQLFDDGRMSLVSVFLTWYAIAGAPKNEDTVTKSSMDSMVRALQSFLIFYCATFRRGGLLLQKGPELIGFAGKATAEGLPVIRRAFTSSNNVFLQQPVENAFLIAQNVRRAVNTLKAMDQRTTFVPRRFYGPNPTKAERDRLRDLAVEVLQALLVCLQSIIACATRPSVLARMTHGGVGCHVIGCKNARCMGTTISAVPGFPDRLKVFTVHHKNLENGQAPAPLEYEFDSAEAAYLLRLHAKLEKFLPGGADVKLLFRTARGQPIRDFSTLNRIVIKAVSDVCGMEPVAPRVLRKLYATAVFEICPEMIPTMCRSFGSDERTIREHYVIGQRDRVTAEFTARVRAMMAPLEPAAAAAAAPEADAPAAAAPEADAAEAAAPDEPVVVAAEEEGPGRQRHVLDVDDMDDLEDEAAALLGDALGDELAGERHGVPDLDEPDEEPTFVEASNVWKQFMQEVRGLAAEGARAGGVIPPRPPPAVHLPAPALAPAIRHPAAPAPAPAPAVAAAARPPAPAVVHPTAPAAVRPPAPAPAPAADDDEWMGDGGGGDYEYEEQAAVPDQAVTAPAAKPGRGGWKRKKKGAHLRKPEGDQRRKPKKNS